MHEQTNAPLGRLSTHRIVACGIGTFLGFRQSESEGRALAPPKVLSNNNNTIQISMQLFLSLCKNPFIQSTSYIGNLSNDGNQLSIIEIQITNSNSYICSCRKPKLILHLDNSTEQKTWGYVVCKNWEFIFDQSEKIILLQLLELVLIGN